MLGDASRRARPGLVSLTHHAITPTCQGSGVFRSYPGLGDM